MKIFIMPVLAAFLLTGCTVTEKAKLVSGATEKKNYPKLTNYQLELRRVGNNTFSAGKKAVVVFRLKNLSKKLLRIEEWRLEDNDNLLVYCQIWRPDMKNPDPAAWVPLNGTIPEHSRRTGLELYGGNMVTMERSLPFVEKMFVPPRKERRYFVKAALNLTSVTVESPVSAIIIRPNLLSDKQLSAPPVKNVKRRD